jgi:Protein of unknown function (DUF1488)
MLLVTTGEPGHPDFETDNVYFFMLDRQQRRIRCAVTLEALETFDPQVDRRVGTAKCFEANRDRIEQMASAKFDIGNTEADGTVMIRAADARLL